MTGGENGWGEYSRLVLKELETLAAGIQQLQSQIQELKLELSQLQAKEDLTLTRFWKRERKII